MPTTAPTASSEILRGARRAARGALHALGPGRVLVTCWPLFLSSVVLTLALQAGGIALVLRFTRGDDAHAWWAVAGMVVLRFLGLVAALGAGALLGLVLTALLIPLLTERIFLESLRPLDAARADALAAAPGLPLREEIVNGLRRLGRFLPRFAGGLLLSFVPLAGLVAGPVVQVYVAARFLGWELLEPWFSRSGVSYDEQVAVLRRHRWLLLGFALPWVPVLALPIVGPFAFTVAQAAAARFVHETSELEPAAAPGDGGAS